MDDRAEDAKLDFRLNISSVRWRKELQEVVLKKWERHVVVCLIEFLRLVVSGQSHRSLVHSFALRIDFLLLSRLRGHYVTHWLEGCHRWRALKVQMRLLRE